MTEPCQSCLQGRPSHQTAEGWVRVKPGGVSFPGPACQRDWLAKGTGFCISLLVSFPHLLFK